MKFIDRQEEMQRLDRMASRKESGLAILYGRRRIGKTRLLLEWAKKHKGLYFVADQSAADVQRRYFANVISKQLSGFNEVDYPDWTSLLERLSRESASTRWRGPLVIDELPYLVNSSPEIMSILQRWLDHEAKQARMVVALAGSSQRMMQGLVLSADAPLYGRANEILHVKALGAEYLQEAFGCKSVHELVHAYAAWGGVPRYWELALEEKGTTRSRFDHLVMNPMGPLHLEPDRLLLEEHPSATELRPVLDAIGMGANRISEIAGRIGHKATSLSRPMDRVLGLGLARREVPFGESEKKSRRSLYRIADPFVRIWFRVVAPNRGLLAMAAKEDRLRLFDQIWPEHLGYVWEDLCRSRMTLLTKNSPLAQLSPWKPAQRWWLGNEAEWDLIAENHDGTHLLFGEAKWSEQPFDKKSIQRLCSSLRDKPAPALPKRFHGHEATRILMVPQTTSLKSNTIEGVEVISAKSALIA